MAIRIPRTAVAVNALIKGAVRISERDHIQIYAAQASFFTVISAIPLIMLALTVLRYLMPISEGEISIFIGKYIPAALIPFADSMAEEIFGSPSIKILSVSALMLLWTASRGIRSVGKGIMSVYGVKERGGIAASTAKVLVFTLIFIAFMAASVSALLFGRLLTIKLLELLNISDPGVFFTLLKAIITTAFLTLTVMIIFTAYCGGAVGFGGHFAGALVTSAGWMIFSFGYTIYIDNFADYSYIYGSLTAVILLMLWLYMVMLILLIGAEINVIISAQKQISTKCTKKIKKSR